MAQKDSDLNRLKRALLKKKIAFLIGNGINRFSSNHNDRSWDGLLNSLLREFSELKGRNQEGISFIELYDLIDLYSKGKTPTKKIKNEICEKMAFWKCSDYHKNIANTISKSQTPVLTTNFDDLLEQAISAQKFILADHKRGFTDYYPWECYFAPIEIKDVLNDFAIWHIHGTKHYPRSIRFGLDDYMGMVQKARGFIRGKYGLVRNYDSTSWRGENTWLNIFFNKSLFIFGLGLNQNEVFLRWMLIERKRYYLMNPSKEKFGWYIDIKEHSHADEGKKFFLEQLGVKVLSFNTKEEFYIDFWDEINMKLNKETR